MELIAEGLDRARRDGAVVRRGGARSWSTKRSAAKRRLPGFGHRVHSTIDPRVDVLFGARRATSASPATASASPARSKRRSRERIKPIPLNIDGALAAILVDLGLPPMVGKLLFIVGRVAGLSAEVLEEYTREKPMRIKIPVTYDGVPPRQNGSVTMAVAIGDPRARSPPRSRRSRDDAARARARGDARHRRLRPGGRRSTVPRGRLGRRQRSRRRPGSRR